MADPGTLQHQNPVQKKEEQEQEGGQSMAPPQFKLSAGGADGGDGVSQLKEGDGGGGGTTDAGDGGVPKEVIDHLKLREGWREVVYLDSLGLPTVGLGHLLTAEDKKTYKVGDKVPVATLEAWAQADAKKAYDAGKAQCATLGVSDQNFINAMASVNFQLGTAWNGIHKKTWNYMVAHEWEKAALEAQDSSWYKQTPVRVQDFQAALRALAAGNTATTPTTTTTTPTTGTTPAPTAGTKYEFKIGAPTGKGTVTAASLNVRTGPGTTYDKTGTALTKGAAVTIYGQANGWYCIGDGQWVSAQYVNNTVQEAGAHTTPAPVKPKAPAGPDLKPIAQNVYDAMFTGGWGMGTDEEKVYTNLAKLNKDKTLIESFKDTYRAMFKRDVVADIQSEFSDSWMYGNQLTKALSYLQVAAPTTTPTAGGHLGEKKTTTPVTETGGKTTTGTPTGSAPTEKLSKFSLSGSVGKTIAGKKGNVAADNFAKDVKMVQSFLVTAGYMKADNAEITATTTIANTSPTTKIPETSLTTTIAAIMEWQKKGATTKGGTADGQISKSGGTAKSMSILTDVHNKYGGEKPLEETKLVLSADNWHSQARYGVNFSGGDEAKETAYKAFVKETAGVDDPAELHTAAKDKIDKVKAEYSGNKFLEHDDVKKHGIREGDKISDPKPNWICCFDTAKKMLGYTGAVPHGADEKIQTFVENNHTGGEFTPQASIGFHYIDGQIRNGKAVFVGVDKISGDTKNYNEGTTDHFMCIVGKGKDDKGWYFRFYDPGSSYKASGTSENNKLYIGANYQSLSSTNYNVSQIRVNEEEGI